MSDLDRLFYWRGITADYYNYKGDFVSIPIENRIALLEAMGVDVSTPEAISEEAFKLDVEPWKHWLPKILVVPTTEHSHFDVNLAPADEQTTFNWQILDQQQHKVASGIFFASEQPEVGNYVYEGSHYVRRRVKLEALTPGYYTLLLSDGEQEESSLLAIYPETTYCPLETGEKDRTWGVIVQLYTLKSSRNWGIGDFTDLRELIEHLAKCGAQVVGLNPLHALSPNLDESFSPYSPSDRRFICPLYIDPYWLKEFDEPAKQSINRELLEKLRADTKVDYVGQRNLKFPVFEKMFDNFMANEVANNTQRSQSFFSFIESKADSLLDFSVYEARHQRWHGARYIIDEDAECDSLKGSVLSGLDSVEGDALVLLFHCYLQWLADEQLSFCQQSSLAAGMRVGLIRDLAVGAAGSGAEVSANTTLFCNNAAVGAPPDPLALTGQNWGLPPTIPSELRRSGYHHFISLLRSNMQHCGALRIDHAMSLMRLWWCPPGKTADYGAYVYYPFEDMLGLLVLESYLNRCMIIGEDLGVVPDEFREAISRVNILSNKVFYFEKLFDGQFKHPRDYAENALAMVNNHDVPTLVSWWNGSDLVLRDQLDLLGEGLSYEQACDQRMKDKEHLLALLYDEQLYPDNWHGRSASEKMDQDLIEAILLLSSRAASKIFVMQLEDLLMMDAPVNVPGTFKEHANWQRKLSASISDMFNDENIQALLSKINNTRVG